MCLFSLGMNCAEDPSCGIVSNEGSDELSRPMLLYTVLAEAGKGDDIFGSIFTPLEPFPVVSPTSLLLTLFSPLSLFLSLSLFFIYT